VVNGFPARIDAVGVIKGLERLADMVGRCGS
jgi:hypothetical protein